MTVRTDTSAGTPVSAQPVATRPQAERRPVAEVMSVGLVSIEADTALEIARRLITVPGVDTLVLVERGTGCVGLIDRTDVRRAMARWWPVRSHTIRARDLIRPPLLQVSPDAPTADVVTLLNDAREDRAVVVDALNRPLGVVSLRVLRTRSVGVVHEGTGDAVTEWDPRLS